MLDLGGCLLLDADNLASAVHLLSEQTPHPSSENIGLIRYKLKAGRVGENFKAQKQITGS